MELNRIYTERSYKVLFLLIYENNILGKKTLVILHLRSLKAKLATFFLRSFLRAQAKHRTGMSMPETPKAEGLKSVLQDAANYCKIIREQWIGAVSLITT